MTEIMAFIVANKWAQRVLLVFVFVVAIFGAFKWAERVGREQGRQEQAQVTAKDMTVDQGVSRKETEGKIRELQAAIDASEKGRQNDRQLFVALATQRQTAQDRVSGMTEPQVEAIVARYSQRDLANCVTQLPICEKQVDQAKKEIEKWSIENGLKDQQYTALVGYTGTVEHNYATLYNTLSVARRKWYCGYLCKKKPHITAPDPSKLERPKLAQAAQSTP